MLLWRVHKLNKGFTLLEMITVVIIVGVIGAIAAPNFLGLLNRNRINEAMRQIEGALKESQKQALRGGQSCSITIDPTDNDNAIANPSVGNGCLLSTRSLDDLIQLNSSRTTITFSGKGNITINDADANLRTPVFVVSMGNGNGTEKRGCVVIENSFGAIRTGDYSTGTIPNPPVKASCQ